MGKRRVCADQLPLLGDDGLVLLERWVKPQVNRHKRKWPSTESEWAEWSRGFRTSQCEVQERRTGQRCGRRVNDAESRLCATHLYRLNNGLDLQAPIGRGGLGVKVAKPCSYRAAHKRCRRLWGQASTYPCVRGCGNQAVDWAYDGTDPTELRGPHMSGAVHIVSVYSQYPEFYMPMCRRCHNDMDILRRREVRKQFDEFLLMSRPGSAAG